MLILKPFSEDQSRSIVQKSNQLLSFRIGVCHSDTCTCPRLLGPCFKTGRKKPFGQRHRAKILPLSPIRQKALQVVQKAVVRIMQYWKSPANVHRGKHKCRHDGHPQDPVRALHISESTQCTLAKRMKNIKEVKHQDQNNPKCWKGHQPYSPTISNLRTGFIRFPHTDFTHF